MSSKELFERLLEHQERHRQAEIDSGQCLSGAHKDDILVDIDAVAASKYASQGQIRTAALSLKLAEREISLKTGVNTRFFSWMMYLASLTKSVRTMY
jgi:recombinational DNA repair ATPase RecF